MRLSRIALLSVPLLFLGITAAGPVGAQMACGVISLNCSHPEVWEHTFSEDVFNEVYENDPIGFHGECNVCITIEEGDTTAVFPSVCHNECEFGEEQQEALAELVAFASTGELDRAISAAQRAPALTQVHEMRRALQILDCQGQVVASVPLGEHYDRAASVLGVVPTQPDRLDSESHPRLVHGSR